jgi:hypothetical protein
VRVRWEVDLSRQTWTGYFNHVRGQGFPQVPEGPQQGLARRGVGRRVGELGANLHDFSRDELGGCISTTVTTPSIDSEVIPAHGTLGVTDSATITVDGADDWDGEVEFFLCRSSELDANGECSAGGTQIGSAIPVTEETTMPVVSATAGCSIRPAMGGRSRSRSSSVRRNGDHRRAGAWTVSMISALSMPWR